MTDGSSAWRLAGHAGSLALYLGLCKLPVLIMCCLWMSCLPELLWRRGGREKYPNWEVARWAI